MKMMPEKGEAAEKMWTQMQVQHLWGDAGEDFIMMTEMPVGDDDSSKPLIIKVYLQR
jgi:hypothetical protein